MEPVLRIEPMDNSFFSESEGAQSFPVKRDILDIMDSYRYMNSSYFFDFFSDGRWDHGTGWMEKNINGADWSTRYAPESIERYQKPSKSS
ncbi:MULTISPECIES: hypothetical protein [Leptospira]|uniref:Uncharacterized protein n=5 Tax=Leptospira santarosai TaxID=28183 RepID=K8Y0C9_9LEPT|nr:hypothetical protein [Leptospira santarosai]EKT86989.1 hypothetical protein LSS_10093 [Leptospira santarosai serovar Shermani str. LT 821]